MTWYKIPEGQITAQAHMLARRLIDKQSLKLLQQNYARVKAAVSFTEII